MAATDPSTHGVPPVNRPNFRLLGGYGLMGLGIPTGGAGLFVLQMIYLPGRGGRPIAMRYNTDQTALVAALVLMAIGVAMVLAGFAVLDGKRRS